MGNERMPWEKTESGWRRKANVVASAVLVGLVAASAAMAMPEACKNLTEICVRGVTAAVIGEVAEGREPMAEGEVVIINTVRYEGLAAGREYTVKGVLVDKNTNEEILVNRKWITAETRFVPETGDGIEEIRFTLDASALAGRDYAISTSLQVENEERPE